ncbi:MAG: BMP family ABC transporter substrate-binding protein [Clostridia bacterium]
MKKILAILLAMAMVLAVVACAPATAPVEEAPATEATEAPVEETTEAPADGAAEAATLNIAMVTDVGNIDDKSFNEGTWNGCKAWAEANGMTANYYRPSEDSNEARAEAVKTAIEKGANVVVCPGYLFGETYKTLPAEYPEVTFIGIDLSLGDVPEPTANTALITYQEDQSGYLAGYAAVKEGFTKLAFVGGIDVPAVIRFGHGFVQGVNDAAKEVGNVKDIGLKYWYSGSFSPTEEIKTKTAGWYTEGTEIIFSCGGGILFSVIASADEADGKLIGVDTDQANQSPRIITSAKKALESSVNVALDALLANGGTLDADYSGKEIKLGAAQDCIGLPTAPDSWRFKTFTMDEYNKLFETIKSGAVTISADIENHPTVDIAVDYQN